MLHFGFYGTSFVTDFQHGISPTAKQSSTETSLPDKNFTLIFKETTRFEPEYWTIYAAPYILAIIVLVLFLLIVIIYITIKHKKKVASRAELPISTVLYNRKNSGICLSAPNLSTRNDATLKAAEVPLLNTGNALQQTITLHDETDRKGVYLSAADTGLRVESTKNIATTSESNECKDNPARNQGLYLSSYFDIDTKHGASKPLDPFSLLNSSRSFSQSLHT